MFYQPMPNAKPPAIRLSLIAMGNLTLVLDSAVQRLRGQELWVEVPNAGETIPAAIMLFEPPKSNSTAYICPRRPIYLRPNGTLIPPFS